LQPFTSPPDLAGDRPDATVRTPFSHQSKKLQEEDEVGSEQLMATQQQNPNRNYPGVQEYLDTLSGKLQMPVASEYDPAIIALNLPTVDDFVTIMSMEKEPSIESENSGADLKT
jgi:hypothetical protein